MLRRLVIATLLFAVVASPAYARRHPRARERRAIAARMHVPPRCARIWISTVDSRWALFGSRFRQSCLRWAGDGYVILHRRSGRWRVVVEGSDIPCPVRHVPAAIVRDLRVTCDPLRAAGAAGAAPGPACSRATAEQVAAPDNPFYGSFGGPERIQQVLCGSFAGPGSDAMAVTFTAGTCWSPQGWALYAYRGGAWSRVAMFHSWLSSPLVAVGSGLHEVDPVFQPSDPRCLPSGGDRWRILRWNGSSLVAGRWRPVKTPVLFWSGAAALTCEIRDDGSDPGSWAYCWRGAYGRARHVRLSSDGRVSTRHRERLPLGLGGPRPPWGATIKTARFRCADTHAGMRCTVRRTGKGFLFDKRGRAHRIG